MKALEKDADKGFQNMDQFIAALKATHCWHGHDKSEGHVIRA